MRRRGSDCRFGAALYNRPSSSAWNDAMAVTFEIFTDYV